MYKFALLCPVALFNFGLYHELYSFLPKLEVWSYTILFLQPEVVRRHSLYIYHWVFAEIFNLDWFFLGIMTVLAMAKLAMFLAYLYTGVELFYVSECLAGYQLE